MSDLKPMPCPFCGGEPRCIERPDNIDGTQFFYALACSCGRHSACAHKMAVEPTPERARHVAIEAWNRRAQPAQAVPLLTEREIVKCLTASGCVGTVKMSYDSGPYEITRTSVNADRFARAIESLVRSKLGAGAPLTHDQWQRIADITESFLTRDMKDEIEAVIGIVGKEGA